jgi:Flp pilus assembly protein TadG
MQHVSIEQAGPKAHRRRRAGNTILEFAIVLSLLVPMFAGAFTIGMGLTKAIQVSNVTWDAVILMVTANTNSQSGLNLSQAQNQTILVQAAQGLGMNVAGTFNPSSTGNGEIILSQVVMVGPTECSSAGLTPNSTAPFWTTSNCANYGSYAFQYRVVIGNTSQGASKIGNPGVAVNSNGTISATNIATNAGDLAPAFPTATGMTLSLSNYALVAEMYDNVSYLNFFNVMSNPIIYARSIS